MNDRFLDSNVLIYAYTNDLRRERAIDLIAEGGVISVQSLAEFIHVARRRLKIDGQLLFEAVRKLTDNLHLGGSVTLKILHEGLAIAQRYKLSIHDSTLIAVALEAGCDEFLSEDLQHGLVIDGRLTIRNPFLIR